MGVMRLEGEGWEAKDVVPSCIVNRLQQITEGALVLDKNIQRTLVNPLLHLPPSRRLLTRGIQKVIIDPTLLIDTNTPHRLRGVCFNDGSQVAALFHPVA